MNLSFLSAKWSDIAAFNYAIEPLALRPFVPVGTELDFFEDETYLSVVALRFKHPRFFYAFPIPGFAAFPMVTFRIYVRKPREDGTYDHGTVFLKEFSALRSVHVFSRLLGKRDVARTVVSAHIERGSAYHYRWGRLVDGNWLEAKVTGRAHVTKPESLEDFIFEKECDFVPFHRKRTLQYRVHHPRWKVWTATESEARMDMTGILPGEISRRLMRPPNSVFIAKGSRANMGLPQIISKARNHEKERVIQSSPKITARPHPGPSGAQ